MTRHRRLAWCSAFAITIAACTTAEPSPPEPSPRPSLTVTAEPAVPQPVEPEPEPGPRWPASEQPWSWYHTAPERLAGGLMGQGFSHVGYHRIVGDPRRYVVEREGDVHRLRRERLTESDRVVEVVWSVGIPGITSDEVVVLTGLGSTDVIVGARQLDGYTLRRYAEDGALRWRASVTDPGRVHAESTALQLGMGREHLVVYNRRESGPYLDEVDGQSGAVVARSVFEPAVMHPRFEWPPPAGRRGRRLGHSWPAEDGGAFVVRRRGQALVVEHLGSERNERWSTVVDAKGGSWWSSAAVLEHDGVVVVVVFHGASSGAMAYGLERRDGAVRFDTSPGSVGSIGHSKYSNDVALAVSDAGHVLAYGNESGGQYIGVIDLATGRLRGCEVWRR